MGLDWKQEVETLEWRIESALTKISECLPTCRISERMETSQFPPLLFLPTMTMPCAGKDFSWAL